MHRSVCALCLRTANLRDSHIIPNAYFKSMKRDNAGKLIAFDSNDESVARQSIESWLEHMLCHECEQRISRWETVSIEMLRRTAQSIETLCNHGGLVERYDYPTLRLFLLSVLWRATVCSLDEFNDITLPTEYQEQLRIDLHFSDSSNQIELCCRMAKIVDRAGVFTAKNFENIAVSPRSEPCGANGKCTFIFGGYRVLISDMPQPAESAWRAAVS